VRRGWLDDFPNLLSYTRFLNKMCDLIIPMLNVISGIVDYWLKEQKPRIKLSPSEFGMMTV
jgi:hypothetical protein